MSSTDGIASKNVKAKEKQNCKTNITNMDKTSQQKLTKLTDW